MNKSKRSTTLPKYISGIHKISKMMLHAGALISIAELITIGHCIYAETRMKAVPLFAVYIPMIRSVLVFAFFILAFSLLLDYVYRKDGN